MSVSRPGDAGRAGRRRARRIGAPRVEIRERAARCVPSPCRAPAGAAFRRLILS
ncbi:hypothetical protein BMA721280_L0523 [Burkholderia mallei 2002721280]|nr:hypothetical protein BMAFMH_E0601 [Burkholderia mallei FMH]EDK61463.1 hypothetical protein BMAJHU_I0505 [Burkholderia mallei JHU]EDK83769.1 hypothetical protein BMA721280_L0523 [Burkholderia mallei 2002721280]